MSKAEINNEIVLMRKTITSARVRCIRKWIKKSNQLKKKKGTEKQIEKNKNLSERLIAQVLAIKKVKQDEITKFALTNQRSQKDLLEDRGLDSRERAIALISFFPLVQEKINQFKKKFPNYEEYLTGKKKSKKKSLNKLGNIEATEKHSKIEKNKNEDMDDNTDSSSSEDLAKKFNIKPGSLIRLKPTEDNSDESDEDEQELDTVNKHTSENGAKKVDENIQNKSPKKQKKSVKSPIKSTKVSPMKNQQGNKRKLEFDNDVETFAGKKKHIELQGSSPTKNKLKNVEKEEKVEKTVEREADPFFISNDSTAYMRVKTKKSVETDANKEIDSSYTFSEKSQDKFFNKKFDNKPYNQTFSKACNNKFGNYGKDNTYNNKFNDNAKGKFSNDKFSNKFNNKNNSFNKKGSDTYQNKKSNFNPNNQASDKRQSQGKNQEMPKQKFTKSPPKQNIHPSWEAKKKQQEALKQGFQGKKIIFDD